MTSKNLKMSYLSKFLSINVFFDHIKYIAGKNYYYNCLKMYFNLVIFKLLLLNIGIYFIKLCHIILMYFGIPTFYTFLHKIFFVIKMTSHVIFYSIRIAFVFPSRPTNYNSEIYSFLTFNVNDGKLLLRD